MKIKLLVFIQVNPNIAASGTVINNLTSPMDSVYIRLEILSSSSSSGMAEVQVEFLGCVTSSLSVTPAGRCFSLILGIFRCSTYVNVCSIAN